MIATRLELPPIPFNSKFPVSLAYAIEFAQLYQMSFIACQLQAWT
jgi:hypothetical protein